MIPFVWQVVCMLFAMLIAAALIFWIGFRTGVYSAQRRKHESS